MAGPRKGRESLAERRIRLALEEGRFENLPGAGKPIPDIDEPYDPLWWVKKLVRRERLQIFPRSLEIRTKVEKGLAVLVRLSREEEVRRRLEGLNAEIDRVNSTSVHGPATTLTRIDVEAWVQKWRQARSRMGS